MKINQILSETELHDLLEMDRRGFLKGLGAATVAGATGGITKGAKAQNVNYAQYAMMAAKKAGDSITSSNWVALSGSAGTVRSYVSNNIQQLVTAYCMDTDAYNIENVIEYANKQSLEAADNVGYTLGADRRTISVDKSNAFVSTYRSVLMQKIREHTNATRQSSATAQTQQVRSLSKEDVDLFGNAMSVYIISKDPASNIPENINLSVKNEIETFIKIFNLDKAKVNDFFKRRSEYINNIKSNNPSQYKDIVDSVRTDATNLINSLKKLNGTDQEFKESIKKSR
jgi:hypothetical protein